MKKKISSFLAFVLMLSTIFCANVFAKVSLPSISKGAPLITYTYNSSGKVYAYTSSDLKTKTGGYIACATDECKIISISGNALQVMYPVSNGTKTAWFSRDAFTYRNLKGDAAQSKFKAKASVTTYKWKGKTDKFGSVAVGDECYLLRGNEKSDWVQIIYPVSGGHKMGWVKGSDYALMLGISGTGNVQNPSNSYTAKLDSMMNGSSYNGAYKVNTKYTGEYADQQCKGFARSVHKKLFGYSVSSTQSKPNNYLLYSNANTKLVGSVTSLNSENTKQLFSQARPGDFVQIRRTHGGSHSAIVYSVSSSGITFYEANIDGKNGIYKKDYTWSDLCAKNSAMSLYTAKNY